MLGAGTYTFTLDYELEELIGFGSFDFPASLALDPVDGGGGGAAVIPLPGAATAGLLMLGGLGVARLRKRR